MSIIEMRMLRWMSEMAREDKIKNGYVRGNISITSIMDKMRENKRQLFGHVMR
jgi:hypothetical protein